MYVGPRSTHFAHSGCQNQLRGSSVSAQHDCVYETAPRSGRWYLSHGDASFQYPGPVCRYVEGQSKPSNTYSALAPLHGLDYIPPSLVALAARKIYPHRIVLTAPEDERSMQWGSSLEAVKAVLDGVTGEDVIEEVLQSVEVPL
jgi:hypothetical protein